jgi:outer membrane protein
MQNRRIGAHGRWVCRPLLLIGVVLHLAVTAKAGPLWELGAGAATLVIPAYRGSSRYDGYLLPLPYLRYCGEHLRVGRDGVRGLLVHSDRVELDISMNGAVPVRSDDVPERDGMPNLDPVFELGPSLDLRLSDPDADVQWGLRLPMRSVFSVGDGIGHVGWVAHPQLAVSWRDAFAGWDLGFSAGPMFGDRRYHAYYYDVEPRYAAAQRPHYETGSGYSGGITQATLSRRRGAFWIGGFVRYDNLDGAAFEGSPLVDSRHVIMAGVAVAWVLKQSPRTVPADEPPSGGTLGD